MMTGPSVRFDIECISTRDVPPDVESFACGDSFLEAIENLIQEINRGKEDHVMQPSGDWYKKYYYTNEDEGYFFYTEEDLMEQEDEDHDPAYYSS